MYTGARTILALFVAITTVASIGCSDDTTRPSPAAGPPSWRLAVGGPDYDKAHSVATDPAGNVFVAGAFWGTADFGGTSLDSKNGVVFLAKYDGDGKLLWVTQASGPIADGPVDVTADESGGVVMAGAFVGDANFGGTILPGDGWVRVFVVKYDADGNALWAARSGGETVYAVGFEAAVDRSGNVAVAGFYKAAVTFGETTLTAAGAFDVFTVKYDAAGKLLWARQTASANNPEGRGVATDRVGNVIVTGTFWQTAVFGTTKLTSAGGADIFITKYNAGGDVTWARAVGGEYSDQVMAIATDVSGNIIAAGRFWESPLADFVVKYDADGNVLWATPTPGLSIVDLATDRSGDVLLTGYFGSTVTFGTATITSAGSGDVYVAKIDADGNPLWARAGGGPGDEFGASIAVDRWGHPVVVGRFEQTAIFGGGTLTSSGSADVFVYRGDQ